MSHQVGIWIDHRKAMIVSALAGRLTALTLESDGEPHAGSSGHAGHQTSDGSQEDHAEKRDEPHHGQQPDLYYDDVISQLGQPDALLIFGPGDAKLQLTDRLSRSKALMGCIVKTETTDTLTDPQIVAKVRQHYGIVPPSSSAVPARVRSGTQ